MSSSRSTGLQTIAVPLVGHFAMAMLRLSGGVIIPGVMHEYGLVEAEGGVIMSSLWSGMALAGGFGGHLSDRLTRKITMSLGLTIACCGILLGAGSGRYLILLSSFLVAGIGSGIFMAALFAFAGEIMPASRGAVVGVTDSIYGLGGFIGPWASAILVMEFGWRSPLYLMGILAAVASLFSWHSSWIERDREIVRKKSRASFQVVFKDVRVILAFIGMAFANFAFVSLIAWGPSYLVRVGGLNLSEAGFSFGIFSLTGALGTFFFGFMSDRVGRRKSILASGIPMFILELVYFSNYASSTMLMILSGALGFLAFAFWTLMTAAVQDHVDHKLMGSATGLIQCVGHVSGAAAPAISGFMIANYGFSLALILSIALPQLMYVIVASKVTY